MTAKAELLAKLSEGRWYQQTRAEDAEYAELYEDGITVRKPYKQGDNWFYEYRLPEDDE